MLVAERLQAAADRLAHAVGQRQLVGRVVEMALGEQQREDLAREERVALGDRVDRGDETGAGRHAARQLDERADVLARQAAEHEPAPGAHDVLQRDLRVRAALGHALVHRDDEQHGGVAQHPRDEVQRHERALVDGLQVVHEDHDRPARAAHAQQRDERVEEPEARDRGVLAVERRRHLAGEALGQLGRQPHELIGGRAELVAQRLAVEILRQPADDLDPRPVRRRGAAPAARPDHPRAAGGGVLGERRGQAGLADARIAEHEMDPATPAAGVVEGVVQLAQLADAPDQRALRPAFPQQ